MLAGEVEFQNQSGIFRVKSSIPLKVDRKQQQKNKLDQKLLEEDVR